jgi:hypothetical protein
MGPPSAAAAAAADHGISSNFALEQSNLMGVWLGYLKLHRGQYTGLPRPGRMVESQPGTEKPCRVKRLHRSPITNPLAQTVSLPTFHFIHLSNPQAMHVLTAVAASLSHHHKPKPAIPKPPKTPES